MLTNPSFRPLSGLSLFLPRKNFDFDEQEVSFRPLSGLSLFLQLMEPNENDKVKIKFPSLLGVISFFTGNRRISMQGTYSFRPLSGLSLFLHGAKIAQAQASSFRPLSGLSLFLQEKKEKQK